MKRYIAVLLVAASLLVSQLACSEGSSNGPKGQDWRRCASVTCTYKVRRTGDTHTAINGVRINLATAVTVSGKWVVCE